MGFGIGWIAVNSRSPEAALAEMGLKRTGESDEMFDFEVSGYRTPSGWYVMIFNDPSAALVADEVMQRLSKEHVVLRANIEEHVMYSSAEAWADGTQQWELIHDSAEGIYHLEVTGNPPKAFDEIRKACVAEQDADGEDSDVDYIFDVPLKLALEVTGFMHDEVPPDDPPEPYEELVSAS